MAEERCDPEPEASPSSDMPDEEPEALEVRDLENDPGGE